MNELPECTSPYSPMGAQRIAIVGGGFSGALVLANLIEQADSHFCVEWFESGPNLGAGIAYGTQDVNHLLNVRAERMGAFADQPDGFWRWLQTRQGQAAVAQICPERVLHGNSYTPRSLYGRYLHQVVENALDKAAAKGIDVSVNHATVRDAYPVAPAGQQLLLAIEQGGWQRELLVDALVLATGNQPPRPLGQATDSLVHNPSYVADIWQPPPQSHYPHRVAELPADSEIVIIGAGLTMVDTVLTLEAQGYQGVITAITRHGWLPAVHAQVAPYPAWAWVADPQSAPQTALGMFTRLRQEIRQAAALGYDWRSVMDSLRPVTQQLWQRLPQDERRRFLRKLFTIWNVHRHRMAPEVYAQLQSLQEQGRLRLITGELCGATGDAAGLTLTYRPRGRERHETRQAALLLNCSGPDYSITTTVHRLLKNLHTRGLIKAHPLGMGIVIDEEGCAVGQASSPIFPLGALLVGERLECTAVPELREQASQIAGRLLRRLRAGQVMNPQSIRMRMTAMSGGRLRTQQAIHSTHLH